MTPHLLSGAWIDDAVLQRHPDYRALLITMTGVQGGPSDEQSEQVLTQAEQAARTRLDGEPPESLAEIVAWRNAYAAFGVKPRQARSSVEALLRRLETGLPRIDRLTDIYNAISIEYLLPIGGENLDRYKGAPRLVCTSGEETFETIADGEPAIVAADPGEVVWRDDLGVTCRRWNWRQCTRTRLERDTANVLFILDALSPLTTPALLEAGEALVQRVGADTPGVEVSTRLIGGDPHAHGDQEAS